jgi:predicted dehydrogenase
MKQILQSLKDGRTEVADIPAPKLCDGQILIQTSKTLISSGTEKMLVDFGKSNLVEKARLQPEKVKQVAEKVKTDGLVVTLEAVQSKLDQPLALGYSNVGRVIETSSNCFNVGERVVSNGPHAEIVRVPRNLCARIPDNVSDAAATFTVLSSIGLQGVRLAQPTIGEKFVVIGLGLIGLLTIQILRANGCRVLGIDYDPKRLKLAKAFGAETCNLNSGQNPINKALEFSQGNGVDAVIITAASSSNAPLSQGAKMCRKRGRIILVGVVGLEINRADFYEKELTFQVSCSYGPGRYDNDYEEKGNDYPIGFVRWTEQRNFEAVLELMADGALDVEPLISHRFEIDRGKEAIDLLSSNEPSLGILLEYNGYTPQALEKEVCLPILEKNWTSGQKRIGFLGAGNHASRTLIPAFQAAGANLHTLISNGGINAYHFGKKYHFLYAGTDETKLFNEDTVDAIVVATRHKDHAGQIMSGLEARKHIYCEKPLCISLGELNCLESKLAEHPDLLVMVGFNRRFSPLVIKMKELLEDYNESTCIIMTINAGEIPAEHWTQDPLIGGGRIIGEACHFIDLARHLTGSPIDSMNVQSLGENPLTQKLSDNVSINLKFKNGSIASINYLANGNKGFPKERVEVFCAGRVLQLDNFKKLQGWGWNNFKLMRLWKQDKGQNACAEAFIKAISNNSEPPIKREEILEVTKLSIQAAFDAEL